MLIGVPKEIKNEEHRVGLTPESVHELAMHGHKVIIQSNAGQGIGASNANYRAEGAKIVATADDLYGRAEMIIKVKEPQRSEIAKIRPGQVVFAYFHLAADRNLTRSLMATGAVCIAYEMVSSTRGGLPLLAPMSLVAGRLAPQAAAVCLQKNNGGSGKLFSGGGGVEPARVVVIGAGVVGLNATFIAMGMGAEVIVIDRNLDALDRAEMVTNMHVKTSYSSRANVIRHVATADVVIGCVLVPGAAAPRIVNREMLRSMRKGSVLVDVAIDQGGCFATSKPTTHSNPTYCVGGILHYCVANIPSVVPHTSTYALNHAILPFAVDLADKGWRKALKDDRNLCQGLSIVDGKLTCDKAAKSLKIATVATKEQALAS